MKRPFPSLLFLPSLGLLAAQAMSAQTTWYADDDSPGDPGAGNPFVSDPLEDGSSAHPFDRIQEAIDSAADGDEVCVRPGTYFDLSTIDVSAGLGAGRSLWIHSTDGPDVTVIDASALNSHVLQAISGEDSATLIEGLTLTGGNCTGAFPNDRGGGLYCDSSSPIVRNCEFRSNVATAGGGFYANLGTPLLQDCRFEDNSGSNGGAAYLNATSATFERCRFEGNLASSQGGALHLRFSGTIAVRDPVFFDNVATGSGGAIFKREGTLTVERGVLTRNMTSADGGAAYCEGTSTFRDCVLNRNTALGSGGGLRAASGSNLTVVQCTLFDQTAGSGIQATSATLTVRNSILWGSLPQQIVTSGGTTTVRHCDVLGGFTGTGNLDVDPLFENAAGPDAMAGTLDDDLSLFEASPCIDAGDTTFVSSLAPAVQYPKDLAGDPRAVDRSETPDRGIAVLGLAVDMGAYEFQPMKLFARRRTLP
jgi:hypothetical protein